MPVYRVHLHYDTIEHQSEDLCFDIRLDGEGRPVGKTAFFGRAGEDGSDGVMPCLLYPDGIIDFGLHAQDSGYRRYSTDLLETPLVEQGRCRVWGSDIREGEESCAVTIERMELLS